MVIDVSYLVRSEVPHVVPTGQAGHQDGCSTEPFARRCGSKAPAIMVCRITAGHSRKPCRALATPTLANRIATPPLKAKRPSTALRREPASLEGRQAMPSPTRAIPANRPSGMPMASGLAPNKSRHGTSGTVRKRAPTITSSHAAAPTTNLWRIVFPRPLEMYALTVELRGCGVDQQDRQYFQKCSADDNRLGCLVQFSTCGIGSKNSSLLPSQCFSCCSLRAPSLKSIKYQAISLSGLEAVNFASLSYFPTHVFPIKTGPYLPLTATCTS